MALAATSAPTRRLDALIEAVLAGSVAPLHAPTEDDFHAAWVERSLSDHDPVAMAAAGGALADRFAWVFQSGYQATLRRAFPHSTVIEGWSALANTEGVDGLPGTTLEGASGARRLSGWKTWVAGADHVERLFVSATHNELPILEVARGDEGVTIERSREGGYLPEFVQGRVLFEATPIDESRVIDDPQAFPTFRGCEGAYVRVALNAFILSHARRLQAPSLIARAVAGLLAAAGAVELPIPSNESAVAIGGVDAQTRALADDFEALIATADPELHERWMRDARMVRRSETLARRADDALARLGLELPRPSSA
ncbi:MAG: hypothetical protein R3C39_06060 [Dehalococcoidia bacterium]